MVQTGVSQLPACSLTYITLKLFTKLRESEGNRYSITQDLAGQCAAIPYVLLILVSLEGVSRWFVVPRELLQDVYNMDCLVSFHRYMMLTKGVILKTVGKCL